MQSNPRIPVRVEFIGIPRNRARVDFCFVQPGTLASIRAELISRFPTLADFSKELLIALEGKIFIASNDTVIESGQTLVLLSADAGG